MRKVSEKESAPLNNQWWELCAVGEPALEELWNWDFQLMGCRGTAAQQREGLLYLSGYFPVEQVSEATLAERSQQLRVTAQQAGLKVMDVTWRAIAEEDWASSWKTHWHPTEIGDRLLINPAWLPIPTDTDRIVLQLNPGSAFGTGAHATTQLCLRALEAQFANSETLPTTFADIGCGTGILAIAALKFGATQAYAADIDPLAVSAAQDCRTLNSINPQQLTIMEGSLDTLQQQLDEPVHGFCCNILARVIMTLIPELSTIMQAQGWGLLSGILHHQIPTLQEALTKHGWALQQTWQQDEWVCLKVVIRP